MKLNILLAGTTIAAAALLSAAAANANIANGSFENADLSGWGGGNFVVTTDSNGYLPTDGRFLAKGDAGCGEGVYCTLSQTFSTTGGEFSGDAAFVANDYLPYNDDAFVSISDGDTTLFFSSIGAVGDYGSSGWTHFTHTLAAGSYTVTAGVRNNGDNGMSSQILIDNFAVTEGGVPEPTSWALMLTGFLGAGAALRSRRRTAVAATA
jgi:hypothetical protein